jgi:hypothetical protein
MERERMAADHIFQCWVRAHCSTHPSQARVLHFSIHNCDWGNEQGRTKRNPTRLAVSSLPTLCNGHSIFSWWSESITSAKRVTPFLVCWSLIQELKVLRQKPYVVFPWDPFGVRTINPAKPRIPWMERMKIPSVSLGMMVNEPHLVTSLVPGSHQGYSII